MFEPLARPLIGGHVMDGRMVLQFDEGKFTGGFFKCGYNRGLSSHESRYALQFIHLNLEKSNVFVQIPPNRVPQAVSPNIKTRATANNLTFIRILILP